MPPAANTPTTAPDLFGPLLLLIVEVGVSLALAVAVLRLREGFKMSVHAAVSCPPRSSSSRRSLLRAL